MCVCVCIGWTKCNVSQPQNVTQHSLKKKKRKKSGADTIGRRPDYVPVCMYVCVCARVCVCCKRENDNSESAVHNYRNENRPAIGKRCMFLRDGKRRKKKKKKKKRPTRDRFPVPRYIEPSVTLSRQVEWHFDDIKTRKKKNRQGGENKRSISCAVQLPSSCIQNLVTY